MQQNTYFTYTYVGRVISPKLHLTNISHFTVHTYTLRLQALGAHIRQTTPVHDITMSAYMYVCIVAICIAIT